MASPQEIRKIRLKNDFEQMKNIRKGNMIDWHILQGAEPYVEEYELKVNVRSIIDSTPKFHNSFLMKVTLPSDYPYAPPQVVMSDRPYPYHPNWYRTGRWCYGTWVVSEGLGEHIIRMIKTLQYDADITNEHSAANSDANDWYLLQRGNSLFPCDLSILPDPTKRRFNPINPSKPRFNINNQ